MRGNRFYTPSLPQYTSQFVEDKTPWGEMLALEDMKINRMDKAEETKAQTDAMMSSLIGGSRTQEIAPQVAMQYKTQLDEWVKKHGNSSYTVPAMRDLTKIRAAWQNDPDVKLIIQDREAEKEYDFYKRDPSYPQMVDPNIDPETRQVRQLKRGDKFTPYARPADVPAFLATYYDKLKPRVLSGEQATYIKDEESGEMIPILRNTSRTILDDTDFSAVREDAKEGLRQAFGSFMTEEEMDRQIAVVEGNRRIDQRSSNAQIRPGYGSGKDKEKEGDATFEFEGATVEMQPKDDGLSPGGAELGWTKDLGLWLDNKIMKTNPEYYNTYKDDPAMLMNPNSDSKKGMVFKSGQLTGGRASKAMIEQRWLEDPEGTEAMFNEYFDQAIANEKRYLHKNAIVGERKRFEKIIENAKKDYKIDDQPYHNDVDLDMALNYINENYETSTPAAQEVFQKFAQGDTDITNNDWITLKASGMKGRKESAGKTFNPKIQTLPEDIYKSILKAYTGGTEDSNNIIQSDGELSGIFAGARIFDPDNQGEEIVGKERRDLLKKGASFILDGRLPDGTHPWKTFILAASIGGKRIYMEGPSKMIINGRHVDLREQSRFTNNAFTFELPGAGGTGDLFSVKNINVNNLMDMQVVDDDNEKKSGNSFDQGIVMRVQRSFRGSDPDDLSESQARPGGNMKLVVYQKDIRGDVESPFNAPLTAENPDGYVTFDIQTDANGRINDLNTRYVAADAYIRMMVLKGKLTKEQGSVLLTKLVMNFGSMEN